MATGLDIVKGALRRIGYEEAETPLEAEDAAVALEELNDMMAEFEASGLELGYIDITSLAEEVRIARGAQSAIKWALGVRIAPIFKVEVTEALVGVASGSVQNLETQVIHLNPPKFPPELPIGAGNECDDYQRFYESEGQDNF